jgi:hypothetical protein
MKRRDRPRLAGAGTLVRITVRNDTDRAVLVKREQVPGRATIQRYLVFPEGAYTHAQVSVQDVETGESDGFVVPLQ